MEAKERSFTFIANDDYYDIPFFQRAYVWDEENWEELLDNFFDNSESHFLGSIILKQVQTKAGDRSRYLVIDGQQRLTTLSILVRACYDRMLAHKSEYEESVLKNLKTTLEKMLFLSPDAFSTEMDVKIVHSHLDAPSYYSVIRGELANKDYSKRKNEKSEGQIIDCYKYFRRELDSKEEEDIRDLWRLLTTDRNPFIVNINLGPEEDEQKIFDTVNSSGVRLSSSDTIKNALYQKLIELLRNDNQKDAEIKAAKMYESTWAKAFELDEDCKEYWSTLRRAGRLSIDNCEMFLYSFAIINGFFIPSEHNRSQLPQKYKDHIRTMKLEELTTFINEIYSYSEVYKKYFNSFEKGTLFSFDDFVMRLLHICNYLDVSTFYPYILRELYSNKVQKTVDNNDLRSHLIDLERYIVLNAICGGTTKQYNNECVQLVKALRVPADLQENNDAINQFTFNDGLRNMKNNKLPTVLLFWVELYNRANEYADIKSLEYTYTLEHIMPQKWQENWSIKSLPVYDTSLAEVEDERDAKEIRSKAVYYIGNMTLLNSKLNTALSNSTYDKKVHGDGKKNKRCMSELADLYLTREVIKEKSWDERNIYNRTDEIQNVIQKIWEIEFPDELQKDMTDDELYEFYKSMAGNKYLSDVEASISKLNTSQETKDRLYRIAKEDYFDFLVGWRAEGSLEEYYGGADLIGLRRLNEHDETSYTKAFISCIEGNKEQCVKYLKEWIDSGEGVLTELDFAICIVVPFKQAYSGFYKDVGKLLEEVECEPAVKALCKNLDDFYQCDADDVDNECAILERVIAECPDSKIANIILGVEKHIKKDWKGVVEHNTKVETEEYWQLYMPEYMHFSTAWAYSRLRDREKAVEYYKKALDIVPLLDNARVGLARELYRLGRYEEALAEYKQCIEEGKNPGRATNGIVRTLIHMGNVEELSRFINNPPRKIKKSLLEKAQAIVEGATASIDDEEDEDDDE